MGIVGVRNRAHICSMKKKKKRKEVREAQKMINFFQMSKMLCKHPGTIKSSKLPKKYRPFIDELCDYIDSWIKETIKQTLKNKSQRHGNTF